MQQQQLVPHTRTHNAATSQGLFDPITMPNYLHQTSVQHASEVCLSACACACVSVRLNYSVEQGLSTSHKQGKYASVSLNSQNA